MLQEFSLERNSQWLGMTVCQALYGVFPSFPFKERQHSVMWKRKNPSFGTGQVGFKSRCCYFQPVSSRAKLLNLSDMASSVGNGILTTTLQNMVCCHKTVPAYGGCYSLNNYWLSPGHLGETLSARIKQVMLL